MEGNSFLYQTMWCDGSPSLVLQLFTLLLGHEEAKGQMFSLQSFLSKISLKKKKTQIKNN